MATITIKNIPEALYERLKSAARANRRSINSQVIVCIERAVSTVRVDPADEIAQARALREITAGYRASGPEIDAAKREGRP